MSKEGRPVELSQERSITCFFFVLIAFGSTRWPLGHKLLLELKKKVQQKNIPVQYHEDSWNPEGKDPPNDRGSSLWQTMSWPGHLEPQMIFLFHVLIIV
jgi:hypothetical protein